MKNTPPTRSYDGEEVYFGIDVHKKTYVIVARVNQTIVKKWTTSAQPEALARQLLKYFAGGIIHSVYESGFSGFVLHRVLQQSGADSMVVHAAAVEVTVYNRVKTDKREAVKLAQQLEAGRLQGIRTPSEVQEQHCLLSRTREQLVQERTAIKQKIRMKAYQFGLIDPDKRREMSPRFVQELLHCWPSEAFTMSVQTHNELGDMSEFANERQLFSYTGLTPSEDSSGEQIHRGHITKQGNRHLRFNQEVSDHEFSTQVTLIRPIYLSSVTPSKSQ